MSRDLQQAWKLRANGRIEACLALLSRFKSEHRIPTGVLNRQDLEVASQTVPVSDLAQAAILTASLYRYMGKVSLCEEALEYAGDFLWQQGITQVFPMSFEKGAMAYYHADYSRALEEFFMAEQHATTDFERLCATCNQLFCLENLGLETATVLANVEERLQASQDESDLSGILSQINTFKMRQHVYRGEIQQAVALAERDIPDLTTYFGLWLHGLPYHASFCLDTTLAQATQLQTAALPFRTYRMRTLTGILHPDDLAEVRPRDFADRLYLWVWRWLCNPEGFPLKKITNLIEGVSLEDLIHRFTKDDLILVRNALQWLGLFDVKGSARLNRVIASLAVTQDERYSLYNLESLFIRYLYATRDQQDQKIADFRLCLEQHELWQHPEIMFRAILRGSSDSKDPATPKHLTTLIGHLREFLTASEETLEDTVTVDLDKGKVSNRSREISIFSQPLANALKILSSYGSVTCEFLCESCLGISNYDSLIHMPRINNLLSRLKKVASPAVSFRVKSGYVIAEGDWRHISFKNSVAYAGDLRGSPEWGSFLVRNSHTPKHEEIPAEPPQKSLDWRGALGRHDIQTLIGRPRSTTNRLLAKWVQAGLVKREGTGRSSRYRMLQPLEI